MPIIQIETYTWKISRALGLDGNWYRLEGQCNRCGVCCKTNRPDCPYLFYEEVDGAKLAGCKIQWDKFASCSCYPDEPDNPDRPLLPGCGYKWVKE